MDIQPILKSVEWAIVTVARNELTQLSADMLDEDRYVYAGRRVEKSLRSMQGLQTGAMPDYNEWDALLYAAWYQPKQTNLAYSILENMRRDWWWDGDQNWWWDGDVFGIAGGKLNVIDFGCGSLAMQFAIAIAAADSISRGRNVSAVRIDSYDSSPAMIWVGQRIWDEFAKIAKHFYAGHPICEVLDLIRHETHTDLTRLPEPMMDTPYLLTALHAAYENTEDEVKDILETLVQKYAPVGFLSTTHSSKMRVLDRASPISNGLGYVQFPIDRTNTIAQFSGELKMLTEWRRSLSNMLLSRSDLLANAGIDTDFVKNFLTKIPSTWKYPDPAIRVYMRSDIDEFSIEEEDDLPW